MPFLSQKDNREMLQGLIPAEKIIESDFSEVFAAGVGQVFDEELSISSVLNMEGWEQRKQQVRELGDTGEFDIDKYTSSTGEFDYERLSTDSPDLGIKSDRTLYDERNELLARRRAYSQDVFDRGSGMAQFLGMATGYMLDPINIATMPIATAGTSVKGLGAIGRALQVGRNEAGLAIAAELMIQPLVYQHKHDINSPFEFKDALLNIVTAATGAAAIGSITGGISGYLRAVREKTAKLPLDDDAIMALDGLARVEDDLNLNRKNTYTPEKVSEDNNFLYEFEPSKLKKTETEFKDVSDKATGKKKSTKPITVTKENGEFIILDGHHRAKFAEGQGQTVKAVVIPKADYDVLTAKGVHQADIRKEWIASGMSEKAKSKGINPIEIDNKEMIDQDADYLAKSNSKMKTVNQPSKVKENYIQPERKAATTGSVTQREKAVIERNGLTKDYDADIEAFKALDNPRIVQDDMVVDADDFMKSIDDEINGIDDVLRCAIG